MCLVFVYLLHIFVFVYFCIRVFLYLLCLFEGRVCVRRRLRGAPSPPQKLEFHFSAESLHAKVVTARRDDDDQIQYNCTFFFELYNKDIEKGLIAD